MLLRVFSMLWAVFAGVTTLPNGIHVRDFPSADSSNDLFEALVGYRTGRRNGNHESTAVAAVVSEFLKTTPAARTLAIAAYGCGGKIEFISDLERTALRVTAPSWARPMFTAPLADFLSETPEQYPELVDRGPRQPQPK